MGAFLSKAIYANVVLDVAVGVNNQTMIATL